MKPGMHFEEKWYTTCVTTIWAPQQQQLQEPNAGPEKVWFLVQRKPELQNFQVTMRGDKLRQVKFDQTLERGVCTQGSDDQW
jgi:hypothetical protein